MNIPHSCSSSPATRPSHLARLHQQLLKCLDIVRTIDPPSLMLARVPSRSGGPFSSSDGRRRSRPHSPQARWLELNDALVTLDKTIAALKRADWDRLGVAVPILGQSRDRTGVRGRRKPRQRERPSSPSLCPPHLASCMQASSRFTSPVSSRSTWRS